MGRKDIPRVIKPIIGFLMKFHSLLSFANRILEGNLHFSSLAAPSLPLFYAVAVKGSDKL